MRLVTDRLLLRPAGAGDIDALTARRNTSEVAEFEDWPLPFERAAGERILDEAAQMSEPTTGQWWMWTIASHDDSEVVGEFNVKLSSDATAAIGFGLAHSAWGNGYATEALGAVADWLFTQRDIARIDATIHPENIRSARVVETCGFVFEGRNRNTMWERHGRVDDLRYSLTPQLLADWVNRPRHRPEHVELLEPYPTGLRHVLKLTTHYSEERLVAPLAISLAQVAVPPFEEGFDGGPGDPRVVPWPRIVHADDEPVGFVMLEAPTEANPEPYLWRLLIDRKHQRRGIGKRVVELVFDQARSWGAASISVSWVPGVGSPEPLYLAMGFEPTGEIDDGEIVARAQLA